ncbi:Nodulation protein G [Nymphon striatum]|nr:Nodulation protein G [Nymphon striatum]
MFDLTGKKALVTGASGGIGEAIARMLHAQGATVGLHGTREEKLQALAGDLVVLPANLSDLDEASALGKSAEEKLEGVDILVNNAGITRDGLFARMSNEDWDDVMRVNLTAVFRLTKEIAYPMMRRKGGRIINITSIVGVTGNPGQANYCASKAGMIGFTKSLAQEIASRNVTLNDKQKEAIMGAIPMKRMGEGNDIASAALYLASAEGGYVTGQTLHVNGGMAMHLDVDADKVTENASFIDDLGADSLDNVELVMAFEEEFDVEIPDDAAETIQTVGDAIKFVEKAKA